MGHADNSGDWLLPMDHSVPLYVKDLAAGEHSPDPDRRGRVRGAHPEFGPGDPQHPQPGGHDLVGSDPGDWLFGSTGSDRILGGLGDDPDPGGQGSDILSGGARQRSLRVGSGDEGTAAQLPSTPSPISAPKRGQDRSGGPAQRGDRQQPGWLAPSPVGLRHHRQRWPGRRQSLGVAGRGWPRHQQITLKDVDLSGWNLSGGSSSPRSSSPCWISTADHPASLMGTR